MTDTPKLEVLERGEFDDGAVAWVIVDTESPHDARSAAQCFGDVTESDETADGRYSFAVLKADRDFRRHLEGIADPKLRAECLAALK